MKAKSCAFTLLEVLVAVAITAVLIGFMVVIVANVSGFWTRSSDRLSMEAQARYVLDQLTLDLQSALFRDDGGVWLAADVLAGSENSGLWEARETSTIKPATAAGTPLRYDPEALAQTKFGQAGTWLRFFTTKRGANRGLDSLSAPIAVGWQIVRRAASASNGRDARYYLHRAETTPAQTLEFGFDLTTAAYAGVESALRSPSADAIVGENVIDFGVRFYAPDEGGALRRIFPVTNEMSHRATNPAGSGDAIAQFPGVVDVCVRVLTDEGARLIAGFEADPPRVIRPVEYFTNDDYWWALARAHSRVFTRRIALPGRLP